MVGSPLKTGEPSRCPGSPPISRPLVKLQQRQTPAAPSGARSISACESTSRVGTLIAGSAPLQWRSCGVEPQEKMRNWSCALPAKIMIRTKRNVLWRKSAPSCWQCRHGERQTTSPKPPKPPKPRSSPPLLPVRKNSRSREPAGAQYRVGLPRRCLASC